MKTLKQPKLRVRPTAIIRGTIKLGANICVLFFAAYGLRQMFATIHDGLSLALTVVIVVLLAYVIHIDGRA